MKAKIVLGLFLGCMLFTLGFLVLSDHIQAHPNPSVLIPRDHIVMWSGTLAMIPQGWQLCDGTNGTPDLRDRFVLGTLTGQAPGETGGSHLLGLTLANLPTHNHSFQTNDAGKHSHAFWDSLNTAYTANLGGIVSGTICNVSILKETRFTTMSGDHHHTGYTSWNGGSEPFDNRPAYYRLAFITRK